MQEAMLSANTAETSQKTQSKLSFGNTGQLTFGSPTTVDECNQALSRMIVCCGLGHSFVENPHVRRWLRKVRACPAWQFPNKKDISRKHIPADFNAMVKTVNEWKARDIKDYSCAQGSDGASALRLPWVSFMTMTKEGAYFDEAVMTGEIEKSLDWHVDEHKRRIAVIAEATGVIENSDLLIADGALGAPGGKKEYGIGPMWREAVPWSDFMLCGCHSVDLIFETMSKKLPWYTTLNSKVRRVLKFFMNHQKSLSWLHEASARLTPSEATKHLDLTDERRQGIKPTLPTEVRMASEVYVMENYIELHTALLDIVSNRKYTEWLGGRGTGAAGGSGGALPRRQCFAQVCWDTVVRMGAVDCVRDLINKGPEEAREDATIAMAAIARHLEAMDPALDELIGLVATGENNDDLFEAFRKEFEPTYYNPVKPGKQIQTKVLR